MHIDYLKSSLGTLATQIPGATGVFHQHNLNFCCGGHHSLAEAAAEKGLDPQQIIKQLQSLEQQPGSGRDWTQASESELIEHLLQRYHDRHREQLPELIRLARKVEQVHNDHPACPHGLADHLSDMLQELESHMLKEEQILFPMLARGQIAMAGGPISVMRFEHDQHGEALAQLQRLSNDACPPEGACRTWQALYLGLQELRQDLMDHIHLENNILFASSPRPSWS
ncbi:MAG: iron-sulfur cluster repair protein YtfE [Halopseudomonas yangmingensis]|uniref:Regulator of cell morphogenesis and NO signaling n=1 Tax=Halopseudomonas yangmingensis TaxID=1720063 RepID=A0A1I4PYM9_9GAMM|nr:iron-sulfur cluster repair protein YtfE [Halopseudomonas yangmingensis]SFM32927.1 regulator of cell morphogenesis and NO signaling [Halopseudomonas yangmingensis]